VIEVIYSYLGGRILAVPPAAPRHPCPLAATLAAVEPSGQRARLVFAGSALAVLAAVVVAIVVAGSGSGEDTSVAPPPLSCLEGWNGDAEARSLGVHQSTAHGYARLHVLRLSEDGTPADDPSEGLCAVVFARTQLDPERGAAAQILVGERWVPLSERPGVEPERLAELQSEAMELANAQLRPDGTIVER
jgi:hypothetical protein